MRTLVVKGSGGAGLGDKVLALASAIAYAKLSDRQLYVDWADSAYGDGVSNYFPRLFTLAGVPDAEIRPTEGSVRPVAWQGKLHLTWDQLYAEHGAPPWNRQWALDTFSFDQDRLDWPEDILVMWDFDQFGRLAPRIAAAWPECAAQSDPESLQGLILRRHVQPHPEIRSRCDRYAQGFPAGAPRVGVHVRAADEHFRARPGAPRIGAYCRAVRRVLEGVPGAVVFLATDSLAAEDVFRREFGPNRVFTTPKWLPPNWEAVHLGQGTEERVRVGQDALADVLLLASCDYLVTLENSSFSILARHFSSVPGARRVILPSVQLSLPDRVWRRLRRVLGLICR